jgi:mercuric ion transport protein
VSHLVNIGEIKMKLGSLSKFFGASGAIVSTMGCSACFPLLASFGATIGLGFLSQYEGLFISKLLPIFASIALVSALFSWLSHRNHLRGILSVIGPALLLLLLKVFWMESWRTDVFYFSLAFMFIISIWDLVSPPHKICKVPEKNSHKNKETTNG